MPQLSIDWFSFSKPASSTKASISPWLRQRITMLAHLGGLGVPGQSFQLEGAMVDRYKLIARQMELPEKSHLMKPLSFHYWGTAHTNH